MNVQALSDQVLLNHYLSGDQSAISKLIERHSRRVRDYINMMVKDRDVAEDIFQETFIKAVRVIDDGRYTDNGKFLSWMPNMYSLGTWYAASMSGDPQYMGSTRGRPVRDARQFMVWRYGIMRWRRRSASSMIARRGCGCFFGRSGGQSKTSAVLHGAHPVQ